MNDDEKHIPPHLRWIATEHYGAARNMERKNGELVIVPHPIFEYSRLNPPSWTLGRTRSTAKR